MNKTKVFEKYINENLNSAYRFAFTYAKNKQDAEDILNESVVKAMRGINSLREEKYIKAWFFKIIANTALNNIKASSKVVYMDNDEMEDIKVTEDDYSNMDFEMLIEKLNVKYKEVVVLRFLENMSISEIGKVLEINENTVKTRLYRALQMLRIDIEEV